MQLTHFKVPPVNHRVWRRMVVAKTPADKRRSYFFALGFSSYSGKPPFSAARQAKISFTANQQKLITTCSGKLAAGNCTAKCNLDESRLKLPCDSETERVKIKNRRRSDVAMLFLNN